MKHAFFMKRCLELAAQARGDTGTNPLVGAVLVRDGAILAEGYHAVFGNHHAERELLEKFDPTPPRTSKSAGLRRASQKISSRDILYVNLEPCCHHTDKKTPACVEMIVERGIKHVVFGMIDPNPGVAGNGIEYLRKHGVSVVGPVMPAECARLNRGFTLLMTKGRPWITAHEARMVDGRHAHDDGSPLKITDKEQDQWSHQFLRARHDAILVGIGTILRDDPMLTVRFPPPPSFAKASEGMPSPLPSGEGSEGWGPWRIVLDPHLRIPPSAKVVNGVLAKRTIIVHDPTSSRPAVADGLRRAGQDVVEAKEKKSMLQERGVRIISVPRKNETFEWERLWQVLTTPEGEFHGITSILVEGGPGTWERFRKARIVDEEVILVGNETRNPKSEIRKQN